MCFAFLLHVTSRFLASTVSLCCSFQSIVCSEDAAWWLLAHTTTPGWISRSRKKWWTVLYVHHRETVSQKLRRLLKKRWNSSGTNSLLLHKCGGIKKKVKGEIHPPPHFPLLFSLLSVRRVLLHCPQNLYWDSNLSKCGNELYLSFLKWVRLSTHPAGNWHLPSLPSGLTG